ncbi:helix-turn-helix domain-containing protein, partial [Pectobacterium sp. HCp5_1]|uniref:helix-turn-helix domain-containing protein n=1 Tax=Pectobacterium sp. HCp5_1 TaxID=3062446 RepID=UPI00293BB132
SLAENTDDLLVGKTLLHGDVLMWLMKTLLTSGCTNQLGAGHGVSVKQIAYQLGFSCPAAFSAAFRSVIGTTPSEF